MDQIKVSVILPVYNPGSGLVKCLKCLQNQSLKEIEMIFIDDCGQDKAKEIIREAKQKDPRIILLENSENMGAGRTRNRGIEAASGEYLSFIDPDDYVSEDFLELLYKKAEETGADIVKGIYKNVDDEGNDLHLDDPYLLNNKIRWGLEGGRSLFALFTFLPRIRCGIF